MSEIKIVEHNVETNEIIEREATQQEIEAQKLFEADDLKIKAENLAREKTKKELSNRLGLTENELKLLIGL
jgi:hypothetical protein